MEKKEFRAALHRNGLSCDEFAAMIGRNISTVYSFGATSPVPYYARLLIKLFDERGGANDLIGRQTSENPQKRLRNY